MRDASTMMVRSLSKRYAQRQVVDDVSFECQPGTITGLLGPNGSGKSTTMRMMIGLTKPDCGTVTFDGVSYVDLPAPGKKVGSLLDPSAHHPGRSVSEVLTHTAMMLDLPTSSARNIADKLGLGSVRRRRFGALSLGMKQRVALAIALLGEPRYLILDEPVNGLDVESSRWLRDTLVHYTKERNGAVLISTHLLNELQAFADNVVVMSRGKVVHSGPIASLGGAEGTIVKSEDDHRLTALLTDQNIRHSVVEGHLVVTATPRTISELCLTHRLLLDELRPVQENLEDAYLRLTSGEYSIGLSQ
ncbi:ABC transporter ATP-binding protein [Jonesia quinghaiensis]|uniref:ABC transporter ATP-binding protein n=1 Tax=Jonesia quinghaiensis TaxID=262806 RepID=UPI0004177B5E|nr:ABC transporter ATP-binding protein [Jonesia quinghaiensis]